MWDHVAMEHDPLKSKLEVPEIRQKLTNTDNLIQSLEIDIQESLDELEALAHELNGLVLDGEMLLADKEMKEYQDSNDIPEDLKISTTHTEEKEKSLQNQIELVRAKIDLYKKRVEMLESEHKDVQGLKETLLQLEQSMNETLTHIPPEQEN